MTTEQETILREGLQAAYHILAAMGRMEGAKAALFHAKKDNDIYAFNPGTHGSIEAAMRRLGMTP